MIGKVLVAIIRFYQAAVSPWLPPSCRYEPSCSAYTVTCIERFGPIKGVFLGAMRIARCHPFGSFGHDPPPSLEPKD